MPVDSSIMADASNAVETVHLSASESADDVDTDITGRDQHSSQRNPVKHRVFKTVCIFASFGALVR